MMACSSDPYGYAIVGKLSPDRGHENTVLDHERLPARRVPNTRPIIWFTCRFERARSNSFLPDDYAPLQASHLDRTTKFADSND